MMGIFSGSFIQGVSKLFTYFFHTVRYCSTDIQPYQLCFVFWAVWNSHSLTLIYDLKKDKKYGTFT